MAQAIRERMRALGVMVKTSLTERGKLIRAVVSRTETYNWVDTEKESILRGTPRVGRTVGNLVEAVQHGRQAKLTSRSVRPIDVSQLLS